MHPMAVMPFETDNGMLTYAHPFHLAPLQGQRNCSRCSVSGPFWLKESQQTNPYSAGCHSPR